MAKSKEQKRQEAEERQAKYDALTLQEKWDLMIAQNEQRERTGYNIKKGSTTVFRSKKVAYKLMKQMNIVADKYEMNKKLKEEVKLANKTHKKSK